jgi:hypothetical protein
MIKLCDSSIVLMAEDGSTKIFETEELQSRIIQSCISAGISDAWIAEDISLSIEYALSQSSESEHKVFTLSEVNSAVIKILKQIGYPEVAESFKMNNRNEERAFQTESQSIASLIERRLELQGDALSLISEEVYKACNKLEVTKAPSTLILELAKYYKGKLLSVDINSVPVDGKNSNEKRSGFQPSKEVLINQIEEHSKAYIENNIIKVFGVSRLFPVIKIEMKILELVKSNGLKGPLTELCVMPSFHNLAGALNNIIYTAQSLYDSETHDHKKALPIYLNIRDMSTFSEEYLSLSWPESENVCMDMLYFLEEMLDFPVFKFTLK